MAWWDKLAKGVRVTRTTSNLPQTKTEPIFAVAGGKVLLTSIVGEITTSVEVAANATKLLHTPTEGTAIDLCAALDFSGYAKGNLLSISGVLAAAMMPAAGGGAVPAMTASVILKVGNIGWNCAASKTGQVQWTLHYIPLDDAGVVTAV